MNSTMQPRASVTPGDTNKLTAGVNAGVPQSRATMGPSSSSKLGGPAGASGAQQVGAGKPGAMPGSTTNKEAKSEKVKDFYKGLLKKSGANAKAPAATTTPSAASATAVASPTKTDPEKKD